MEICVLKMKQKDKLGIVIFINLLVILIALIFSAYYFEDHEIKEVPCYDRYGNVIRGEICEETNGLEKLPNLILIALMLTGGMIFVLWFSKTFIIDR